MSELTTPRNGMALAALILGILALLLSPVGIGALVGIVALILGIISVRRPSRRGFAVTGIVTGAISIPLAAVFAVVVLPILILMPALGKAREKASETRSLVNMRSLSSAILMYSADYRGQLPAHLSALERTLGGDTRVLQDRRQFTAVMTLPPGSTWADHPGVMDAHCDFYYAVPGVRASLIRKPTSVVILYDKPGAGPRRLLAFADGHVEAVDNDPLRLDPLVDATNQARAAAGLPPLPPRFSGPPPSPAPLAPAPARIEP